MDVVAHGGAVARRVVGAEHLDVLAHAGRGLEHERDQVRLGLVVLAQLPARARDVEVAQRGGRQPVRAALVADHQVDRELGRAVGVDRRRRLVLGDRHDLRLAVGRAGRGEHEPADAVRAHRVEQVERADEVVAPVALRVLDRLRHERERREVQHAVDAGERARPARPASSSETSTCSAAVRDGARVAAREVVEHDDLVAGFEQLLGDHRADVARAARHEDPHSGRHRRMGGCIRRLAAVLAVAFAVLVAPAAAQDPTPTADAHSDAHAPLPTHSDARPVRAPDGGRRLPRLPPRRRDRACEHKRKALEGGARGARARRPTPRRPTCARRSRRRSSSTRTATATQPEPSPRTTPTAPRTPTAHARSDAGAARHAGAGRRGRLGRGQPAAGRAAAANPPPPSAEDVSRSIPR